MSSYAWRQLGLTKEDPLIKTVEIWAHEDTPPITVSALDSMNQYIQYSNACARAVRNSLKPDLKVDAMKRGNSIIKVTRWEAGKPIQSSVKAAKGSG